MLGVFALHHTFFFFCPTTWCRIFPLCAVHRYSFPFLFVSLSFLIFPSGFCFPFLQFSISSFFSLHFLLSSMLHSLDFLFSLSFILFNSLNSIA